jgi:biotin-dependent carboxylase-like uncharacterized protein
MAQAHLKVAFAGPHVSVQDGGRPGMMRFGVPASGAMDRKALAIANVALGNPAAAPCIEASAGGLTLDCLSGALTLAVAGGGFVLDLDGSRRGSWSVFTIRAGQRLTIRPGHWGSWTYLAFAGSLAAPLWLGSRSTHAQSGLGGGRVVTGQDIRIGGAQVCDALPGDIPCPVWARPRHALHAVPGPQDRFFPADALHNLASSPFYLTDAYDRMGVRLKGPDLAPQDALSIPSQAILRGSVQVAGDGVPTVLLSDHQTTGGYPKIATILADDLDGFAQLRPRDAVRFHMVSAEQAVRMARQRALAFARYMTALGARHPA